MEVVLIAAVAKNRAIGKNNDLIWDLPVDMKFFRDSTVGFPVITGRKNYESIPPKYRPLKNRVNIVVTRNQDYRAEEGVFVTTDLENAVRIASELNLEKAFIIGGGQIYKASLELGLVDTMLLTQIEEEFDADVFFPEFDLDGWNSKKIASQEIDERHSHRFDIFEYTKIRG